jgi:hypothetical protein
MTPTVLVLPCHMYKFWVLYRFKRWQSPRTIDPLCNGVQICSICQWW